MLDLIPVVPFLRDAIDPLTRFLHLHTLPLHLHEVLLSYTFYTVLNDFLAPHLSAYLLAETYDEFPLRTKLQWNIHVTSFVNSTFVSMAALYVLYADRDRLSETWEERMWGYTGLGGMVQAFGAGYFVWDVQVCVANLETLGVMDLLHAVVALSIAILGFYPFGLYYGIQYALVELSTPLVNIHWFLNKLNKAGSTFQIINGVLLIVTFACCRLVWGSYLTFVFFRDVWTALHASQSSWTEYKYSRSEEPLILEHRAPWWLAVMFMISNAVVMSLSAFWFTKMITTIRNHIDSPRTEKIKSS
ncbi:hypothetical protein MMC11_001551 [Xylographa trunciseda]|nr:hypothetical protein [Xylographa trunciseda]